MVTQSLQTAFELFSNTGSEEFIKDIVAQTSGFMPRDIRALIADAGANLISRGNVPINSVKSEESDGSLRSDVESDSKSSEVAPQVLGKDNLTKALERSKKRNASALGTPKVPNVKWEDVGSLEDGRNRFWIVFSYLFCTRTCFHLVYESGLVFFYMAQPELGKLYWQKPLQLSVP
ncbi:hypothetical protein ACFX15_030653 [Malus domestica]